MEPFFGVIPCHSQKIKKHAKGNPLLLPFFPACPCTGFPTCRSIWPAIQDLTYVEFFAGVGNVWAAVRADHNMGVPVDIEYWANDPDSRFSSNPMDINSDSGLALLCLCYLERPFSWMSNKPCGRMRLGDPKKKILYMYIYICIVRHLFYIWMHVHSFVFAEYSDPL